MSSDTKTINPRVVSSREFIRRVCEVMNVDTRHVVGLAIKASAEHDGFVFIEIAHLLHSDAAEAMLDMLRGETKED